MLVLAAVREDSVSRLRRAAGHRFTFRFAKTWDDALTAILREPVEMAVFDPALESAPRTHEIERLRILFPSLPMVLYARLTPAVARILLRLGQSGIRDVLFIGHDDHSRHIAELLTTAAGDAVSARLISAITDVLADCPGELRWAIETTLREPGGMHTVKALAARARMDRRTLLRWFAKAGLPPPSTMLVALRAVYAHRLLQDPGYTVEDVAAKVGYGQVRTFVQHMKEVFGMTPGEIRVGLTSAGAMQLLRQRYLSNTAGASAPAEQTDTAGETTPALQPLARVS